MVFYGMGASTVAEERALDDATRVQLALEQEIRNVTER